MKGSLKLIKFVLLLSLIKIIKTKPCLNKTVECESCDVDKSNMASLTCNTFNKSSNNEQIFNKIQLLVIDKYRLISIKNKIIPILPSYVFNGKDILTLILNNNQIECILNDTFSGIKSLEYLDLSDNKLKSIDSLILSFNSSLYLNKYGQFASLKTIDLISLY